MTDTGTTTPIQSAAEAIKEVIGSYDPENLMSCGQIFPDLGEFMEALSESLDSLAGRLEESPLDQSLVESLREMSATVAGLADTAREGEATFGRVHEDDIKRINEPRTNEQMADFSAHQ